MHAVRSARPALLTELTHPRRLSQVGGVDFAERLIGNTRGSPEERSRLAAAVGREPAVLRTCLPLAPRGPLAAW
jgi:hypothetical protein